ncbi:L-selectin-like [Pecten maximus]|uniref:L-selectin-like n=1 Tax=Pecten maximus TaxID=6579 RepID=UPI001458547F|nr:L-selectin-like [Pecten maximus]
MLDTMTGFTILLLQVLLVTFVESQLSLECPAGYDIKDSYCYKKVYATFPWEKAQDACEREGSRLVWIDDWYENDYVQKLLTTAPEKMYWTGLKKTDSEWKWTGNSKSYNLYYGFWETMQPDTSSDAECVAGMVNGNWMLVPCQKMLPFICKTTAYPPGSFKCSKGPAISNMHKCDGYNDCEDGSDEVPCDSGSYCNWYSSASSGTKQIYYLTSKTCLFTLKANIGERIKVTLSSALTTIEEHADSLKVYTGGLTTSESYLIGTVKGSLSQGTDFHLW